MNAKMPALFHSRAPSMMSALSRTRAVNQIVVWIIRAVKNQMKRTGPHGWLNVRCSFDNLVYSLSG